MSIFDIFSSKKKLAELEEQIRSKTSDLQYLHYQMEREHSSLEDKVETKRLELERLDKIYSQVSGELRQMKEQKSELELAITALTKQKEEIAASYQMQAETTRLSLMDELDAFREQCEKQKAEILSRYKHELEEERMRMMEEHYAALEKQLSAKEHIQPLAPLAVPETVHDKDASPTSSSCAQETENSSPAEYSVSVTLQDSKPEPAKTQMPSLCPRRKNIVNPSVSPRDTLKDKPKYEYSPYTYMLRPRLQAGYKRLTETLMSEKDKELCVICSKPTQGDEREILSNGLAVHIACRDAAIDEISRYKSDEEIPKSGKAYERLRRLMIVNNYWKTYPDDWEQRKAIILDNADYQCEECDDCDSMLHVHHKQWLSQGGSNLLENLACLCSSCHDKAHGKAVSESGDYEKGKNRTMIDEAMCLGKDVEFNYVDMHGERTRRAVTPLKYIKSPHGHPALSAMDHLEKAPIPYTFLIKKMTHMKIVDRVSTSKSTSTKK